MKHLILACIWLAVGMLYLRYNHNALMPYVAFLCGANFGLQIGLALPVLADWWLDNHASHPEA